MFVRSHIFRPTISAFVLALALVGAMLAQPSSNAAAAALTSVAWSVSNTATSQTNVNYAWNFKTGSAGTIKFVVLRLPAGTAGTPAVSQNIGIGAGTVSAITGCPGACAVTYTVTAAVAVPANYPIYIELSGFTNTATAGTYTSTVTTQTSAPATIDGPTTTSSQTFSSSGVAVTVAVAKSALFSIDTNSFTMLLDPAVNTSATQMVNIGVSSNAKSGYTLNCKVDVQPTNGSFTLGAFTTNMASAAAWASGGAGKFGYAMAVTNNGTAGSPAAGGTLSATNFAGFTTAGENCATATGKSGNPLGTTSTLAACTGQSGLCDMAAHWWQMNVKAAADFTTEALTYTDNITLTLTPTY